MSGVDLDPLAALLVARQAFGTSTERDRLAALTDLVLPVGEIVWLEVGVGNGCNLTYQLAQLSARRRIQAVALEPSGATEPPSVAGVTWLRLRVEDYWPDRWFDWINIRHSAYYLVSPFEEIERLSTFLSDRGALALTHWSSDCVLHRLHQAICGTAPFFATAGVEAMAATFAARPHLVVSAIEFYDTKLLVDRVLEDPAIAVAIFELARRGRKSRLPCDTDRASFVAKAIQDMRDATVRRNGIVLVKRRQVYENNFPAT